MTINGYCLRFLCVVPLFLYSCSPTMSPTPPNLNDAAAATSRVFHQAVYDGVPVWSEDIPKMYWSPELEVLKPIRIYIHRVNVVLVQEEEQGIERGVYFQIPESSYICRSGEDGFTFDESGHYERRLQTSTPLSLERE